MVMRAHGQATVWGSRVSVARNREGLDWIQRLLQWIESYRIEHKRMARRQITRRWDPQREAVRPEIVESALDYTARRSGSGLCMALYSAMV